MENRVRKGEWYVKGIRGMLWAIMLLTIVVAVQGAHAEPRATGTVTIVGTSFQPATITIQPGDTVEWVKSDGFHNVVAEDGSFRSGDPTSDSFNFSHTFTQPGEYKYFCQVHGGSGMRGTIIVAAADANHMYLPMIME